FSVGSRAAIALELLNQKFREARAFRDAARIADPAGQAFCMASLSLFLRRKRHVRLVPVSAPGPALSRYRAVRRLIHHLIVHLIVRSDSAAWFCSAPERPESRRAAIRT